MAMGIYVTIRTLRIRDVEIDRSRVIDNNDNISCPNVLHKIPAGKQPSYLIFTYATMSLNKIIKG